MTFLRGDAHGLDFPDRSFDAVVCLRVLMHTPDWRASLRELCRVSAGRVVFDYPSLWSAAAIQAVTRRIAHLVNPSVEAYRVFSPRRGRRRAGRAKGSTIRGEHRQFVLPIALHKRVNSEAWTRRVEGAMEQDGADAPVRFARHDRGRTVRVLVTGATGFTGGHLARALRARGDEVTAMVRSAAGRRGRSARTASAPSSAISPGPKRLPAAVRGGYRRHLQHRRALSRRRGSPTASITRSTRSASAS